MAPPSAEMVGVELDPTSAAIARDADLTGNAIGRIERGQADPGLTSIVRIADALGVSPAEVGAALDDRRRAERSEC